VVVVTDWDKLISLVRRQQFHLDVVASWQLGGRATYAQRCFSETSSVAEQLVRGSYVEKKEGNSRARIADGWAAKPERQGPFAATGSYRRSSVREEGEEGQEISRWKEEQEKSG
jgi:hypothetical protein